MLKKINNFFNRKIKSNLVMQLTVSVGGMFLIIITVSSILIYIGISNILKDNSEQNTLEEFMQNEHNINTFCNEVDLISKQLISNTSLLDIKEYENLLDVNSVVIAKEAFDHFYQVLLNYQYVDSIIYYDDTGLILKATFDANEIILSEEGRNDRFYDSDLYTNSLLNKAKLTWCGGYTNKDFSVNLFEDKTQEIGTLYYISAARSLFSMRHSGVLIINVDMKYFNSIYNSQNDKISNDVYIINSLGEIVSNSNQDKIGEQSTVFKSAEFTNEAGNFTTDDQDVLKQVNYYKLESMGWVLVREIPINVITKDISKLRNIIIFMFAASLIMAFALSHYWIFKITKPIKKLVTAMEKMEKGHFGMVLEMDVQNELSVLVQQFNKMSVGIRNLISQKEAIQDEKRRIEIEALQSQINPHFLYNTINTIKWMAASIKADSIANSLTDLGEILHPIFKHDIMCSIKEEISYLEHYIKIMNYRFAEAFKVNIFIPKEILEYQILRFVLQPIIENSIKHGLMEQNGGEIEISAYEEQKNIIFKITDNGVGIDESRLQEINKMMHNKKMFLFMGKVVLA